MWVHSELVGGVRQPPLYDFGPNKGKLTGRLPVAAASQIQSQVRRTAEGTQPMFPQPRAVRNHTRPCLCWQARQRRQELFPLTYFLLGLLGTGETRRIACKPASRQREGAFLHRLDYRPKVILTKRVATPAEGERREIDQAPAVTCQLNSRASEISL
jgi:hypothetical protein